MPDSNPPGLGKNTTAGDVVRVLVKPGDTIAKDQAVLELETDKATIEVPSSVAGLVKDVQVKAGQKITVGQTILSVDDAGAGAATPTARPKQAEPEKPAPDKPAAAKAAPEPEPEDGPQDDSGEVAPRQKRGEVVDISLCPRAG